MTAELWTSLLAICGVWALTVLSPGPNFIATLYVATTRSRRASYQVVAGITAGTTIWATASLLGLSVLFQTAGWLFLAVKYAGAAYLICLGVNLLRQKRTPAAQPAPTAASRAFRLGLLTDLSNPKAAAFFTSLFAVAIPPDSPVWFEILIVVAVVALAAGWYAFVASAANWEPIKERYHRVERAFRRAAGALFVAFGLKLIADR